MPKNKATSRGSARSQLVRSATRGHLRGCGHLSSNAPGSRPRRTAISQSAPARASVPSPPDNGSVPTSLPSCQLDLSSMTMDSLVRVIQNQISLLTQTGSVSMSPGPQPTSLPQPVVAPLAPIQPVPVAMPLAPLPATLPPSSSTMLAGTCHVVTDDVYPYYIYILVLISGVREYYYYVCVDIRYTCVLLLCMCYSHVLCIGTVLMVNFHDCSMLMSPPFLAV